MAVPAAAHGAGQAPSVHSASSADEIRAALKELGQREASITSRLDALLASQKHLNRNLARLDLARAQLGTQVVATRNISHGMLSAAAATAHRISDAVKKLDREQAAVKATLNVVEQVAELKACVLGVHGSMGAPQDWETAANYLRRAALIPDAVIDGVFADEIVPSAEVPDPPRQTLENAAGGLCTLFLREFERAAQDGDGARVTRFFKLFPLIGRSQVGLDAYGRYVCGGIASKARSGMSGGGGAAGRRDGMFYAQALTRLFEHIAQIVDGHEALVERHYGPGSMTKVIERIQVEADAQAGLILDTWAEERSVARKLTDIKSYPFNFLAQSYLPAPRQAFSRSDSPAVGSGRAGEDDGVDMKEIDALLNEATLMLGRWSLYTRFLASKVQTGAADAADARLALPAFILHSTLQKKVTDHLVEPFTLMATFFFRRSVEKAFQLDEAPAGLNLQPTKPLGANPPYITSAVDDVMYVGRQVLVRALATAQRPVVASILPALSRILGGDFFGMVQRKMRDESYPKPAIPGTLPPEGLVVGFLVLMNNLDVATDYLGRIVASSLGQDDGGSGGSSGNDNSVNGDHKPRPSPQSAQRRPPSHLAETFPFGHEAAAVEKALRGLDASFRAKTAELLTEATEVLRKHVMAPRLKPVLAEAFKDVEYGDSDDSDDSSGPVAPAGMPHRHSNDGARDGNHDDSDGVPTRFAHHWHVATRPLQRLLTPAAWARLLATTLAHLARALEKRMWAFHGRVSALGAVRLERDVAGIVAAAVASAGGASAAYALRDVFARCTQMGLVLNMEEEEWEEVLREEERRGSGAGGMVWRLDAEERKRVRGMMRGRS